MLVPAAEADVLDVCDGRLRVLPHVAEAAADWACADSDAAAAVVDPAGGEGAKGDCAPREACGLQAEQEAGVER